MTPTKGYNYKNWNSNFDEINWSPKFTPRDWVHKLGLLHWIIDYDGWSSEEFLQTKVSLREFLVRLALCTVRDVRVIDAIICNFDKDPDFVTCAECGLPRKWEKLSEMKFGNGDLVCQKCNFN